MRIFLSTLWKRMFSWGREHRPLACAVDRSGIPPTGSASCPRVAGAAKAHILRVASVALAVAGFLALPHNSNAAPDDCTFNPGTSVMSSMICRIRQ